MIGLSYEFFGENIVPCGVPRFQNAAIVLVQFCYIYCYYYKVYIFSAFQGVTKRIGQSMHEWAAKVDEYARGMVGPLGSTLFEELGLYYIGPVDGHNIEDLICVLQEVASLDSMGPVLVHVITEENQGAENNQNNETVFKQPQGMLCFLC